MHSTGDLTSNLHVALLVNDGKASWWLPRGHPGLPAVLAALQRAVEPLPCRELAAGGRAPRARGPEGSADAGGGNVTDRAYQREYLQAPDAKRARRD